MKLPRPLRRVQARIDAWILARVPREAGPIRVSRRRVYILPTRFGAGFALMQLALLLGAMNYGNSMAFLLVFLLAGLTLVSMHHTHANLVSLELQAGVTRAVFAGDTAQIAIRLHNPSRTPRYSLLLSWRAAQAAPSAPTDLEAGESAQCVLALPAPHRGRLSASVFRVASEYPLGLFRAWTWAELDIETLVFPTPAPPGLAPPGSVGHGGTQAATMAGREEFNGLRSYQRGDSAHAIHWKSLPKTLTPMVKQFADTVDEDRWLDWEQLAPLGIEARLSQLTRWVLDLDALQRNYGLRLPGLVITPASGEAQRFRCLKALALFAP